jgi:hypothetical protein
MLNGERPSVTPQLQPLSPKQQQFVDDNDWAMDNFDNLLQKYAGEFVVVWKKQILAHGSDWEQLLQENATEEHPREELVLVECPDPLLEMPSDCSEGECQ